MTSRIDRQSNYDITSKCININSAGGVVSEHSNIYHVANPLYNYAIAREGGCSGRLIYSDYSITNGTRVTRGKAGGDLLEGANAKLGATVSEIGLKDPNNDDFSLTADSLSLGTGRPSFYGGNADRGAWRGTSFVRYIPPNCTAPLEMDFNDDCKVDMMDFALFALQWLSCNIQP